MLLGEDTTEAGGTGENVDSEVQKEQEQEQEQQEAEREVEMVVSRADFKPETWPLSALQNPKGSKGTVFTEVVAFLKSLGVPQFACDDSDSALSPNAVMGAAGKVGQ